MITIFSNYKGYFVGIPTTGGKAGKGCNKTSSVQVRKDNRIVKNIRFNTGRAESKVAIGKAVAWIDLQGAK